MWHSLKRSVFCSESEVHVQSIFMYPFGWANYFQNNNKSSHCVKEMTARPRLSFDNEVKNRAQRGCMLPLLFYFLSTIWPGSLEFLIGQIPTS